MWRSPSARSLTLAPSGVDLKVSPLRSVRMTRDAIIIFIFALAKFVQASEMQVYLQFHSERSRTKGAKPLKFVQASEM